MGEEKKREGKGLRLPAHDMPQEWDDDERMAFLFSNFKTRSLNPISWDSKMNFWKGLIQNYCVANGLVVFDEAQLRREFERNEKRPSCLSPVLDALKRDNRVTLRDDYVKQGFHGPSWTSWTKEVVLVKPTAFAMGKFWSALGYSEEDTLSQQLYPSTDKFICLDALKVRAEQLLRKHSPDPHCHLGTSQAVELPLLVREEGEDVVLLIMALARQSQAEVDERSRPVLVKFGVGARVTELDRQTVALRKQEELLERRMRELEAEQTRLLEEARELIKKNMRQAAKGCLRRKREVERRLDKVADTLTNVHVLMSHVEDSESNAKVLESYKLAAGALKTAFKEAGLSEDGAAKTMDDVEEVLDLHEDVKTLISQPVAVGGSAMDDSLFEDELAALVAEEQDGGGETGGGGTATPSKDQSINLADLPEVPSGSPASSVRTHI